MCGYYSMSLPGLVAEIGHERRVYVVTIPAPDEYRHISDRWPRVVGDR